MNQHAATLDVAKETVADPDAFRSPFNQARNVGEHEFTAPVAHHAKLGNQCGEGIVADLGLRVRDRIDEGRFARIGQADEADIREQLQPQPHPHLLARQARLVLAGGAVGRGLVRGISAPTHPAFEEGNALADHGEVGEHLLPILGEDLCADRHLDHERLGRSAGAVLSHPVPATRRLEVLRIAEVDQRVEARDGFEHDIAAVPAVSAVRAAVFDVHLAPERDGPRAASAGFQIDLGLVEKMHGAP